MLHVGHPYWKQNHFKTSPLAKCLDDLIAYLDNLGKEYGEPQAMRFVREEIGIGVWDSEVRLLELPLSYSKQRLYVMFCFECGWDILSTAKGNYGRLESYPKRQQDDMLWPEASEVLPVCSWSTF